MTSIQYLLDRVAKYHRIIRNNNLDLDVYCPAILVPGQCESGKKKEECDYV